jgi:hypothetical protein
LLHFFKNCLNEILHRFNVPFHDSEVEHLTIFRQPTSLG